MDRKFEKNQRQVPVSNGFRELWPPNYPSTSPDQYERAFNFGGDVIYERPVVKRGGADFVSQGSRTSPSPSASVDLAHLRPVRRRFRCAPRDTSSEPEAQGELPPSVPAVYEALTDVT